MKMKIWKKSLAMLLCTAMCLGFFPVSAYAEEELPEEPDASVTDIAEDVTTPETEAPLGDAEQDDLSEFPAESEPDTLPAENVQEPVPAQDADPEEPSTGEPGGEEAEEDLELASLEEEPDDLSVMAASSGSCGDNLTWTLSEDGTMTISGQGAMYDYTEEALPEWAYNSAITKIVVEPGVTAIGDFAFLWCSGCTEVSLPDTLTAMGEACFCGCEGLSSASIPAGVRTIGDSAFEACYGLSSISLPDGLTALPAYFLYYTSVTEITVPESVTSIGEYAFGDCSELTRVMMGNNVVSIGSYAFYRCSQMTGITIGDSVVSIGESAFYNCNALSEITLPTTLTSIGKKAFYSCRSLTEITLPATLTGIGDQAFYNCSGLEAFHVDAGNPVFSAWNGALLNKEQTSVIAVPANLQGAFSIPASVKSIAPYAFYGSSMTEIVLPAGVESIGEYAFSNCKKITEIEIPGSVTEMGNYAFSYCAALTNAVLNEGIQALGNYAFYNCRALTRVDFPASLTTVGNYAFYSCSALTSIYYAGSQWAGVQIGSYNDPLLNATVYYTSGSTGTAGLLWSVSGEEVTITGCTDELPAELYIPSQINDLPVTAISAGVFAGRNGLNSVIIPGSIKVLPNMLFSGCVNLQQVRLLSGVTTIGSQAFYNCGSLSSLTVPASVAQIAADSFAGCTGLKTAGPASSGSHDYSFAWSGAIPDYAFSGCTGLTSVKLTGNMPTIGEHAFQGVTTVVNYPGTNSTYTDDLLTGYGGNLTWRMASGSVNDTVSWTMDHPGVLTLSGTGSTKDYSYTGSQPWYSYKAKVKTVVIGNGITHIGNYAFDNHKALTTVELPSGLYSIGRYAFTGCSALTALDFPSSLHSIGDSALYNCTALSSVVMPAGVTEFGSGVFTGCTGLTSAGTASSCAYRFAWTNAIPAQAFSGCSGLTQVTLPSTVASIGSGAFSGCTGLTRITIPTGVTSIGSSAFSGCTGLTGIQLPSGLTEIGDSVFYNCSGFTGITLPSGPESIGDYAFSGCSGLTALTIPDTVTSIGSYAFSRCTSLTGVNLPNDLTSLGNGAFSGCTALSVGSLPSGVTAIGDRTFYNCTGITRFYVNQVTSIGAHAFEGCSALTEVNNTSYLTSIGEYAFSDCTSLHHFSVSSKVTRLEPWLFSGCSTLWSLSVGSSVTAVGKGVVNGCDALNHVYYGGTRLQWEKIPVADCNWALYQSQVTYEFGKTAPHSGDCGQHLIWELETDGELIIASKDDYSDDMYDYPNGAPWAEYADQITKVTLCGSVLSVGAGAFRDCSALTEVTILATYLKSIGARAFSGCTGLESILLGGFMKTIGAEAFAGSGLTEITLPSGVTSVGEAAFANCVQLETIAVDGGNTSYVVDNGILYSADRSLLLQAPAGFQGELEISADVSRIGKGAFYGCAGLTAVSVPESVTTIPEDCFRNCAALGSISLPAGLTAVGDNAFSGCDALAGVAFAGSAIQWNAIPIGDGNEALIAAEKSFAGGSVLDGGVCGADLQWELDYSGLLTISGSGPMDDWTTLASVPWSGNRGRITRVVIGRGVTSVGDFAFASCTGLTSVSLPDTLQRIGENGFASCSALSACVLPPSLIELSSGAFPGCSSLVSISVPAGVETIPALCFTDCSSLASVSLPASLTAVGSNAFRNCGALTAVSYGGTESLRAKIDISADGNSPLTEAAWSYGNIEDLGSFEGGFTWVLYSDGSLYVDGAGEMSFTKQPWGACCSQIKKLDLGEGILSIADGAFSGCSSLTQINLPDSLQSIGEEAFSGCSRLQTADLPDSVTEIGAEAFCGCSSLFRVKIPAGVTEIEQNTFAGCTGLIDLIYAGTTAEWENIQIGSGNEDLNRADLLCSDSHSPVVSLVGSNNMRWRLYDDGELVIVGQGAMNNTVRGFELLNSHIGEIRTITVKPGITTVGQQAFSNCTALESFTLPDSVAEIYSHAFEGCSALTELNIPETVTGIYYNAFKNCTGLRKIRIQNGAQTFGDGVFEGCSGIRTAGPIGTGAGYDYEFGWTDAIPVFAFSNCGSLISVVLPDGLTTIGHDAFFSCEDLETINIPDSVTEIEQYAFYSCKSLTSIIIPEGVTELSKSVFSASGLEEIYLPVSLREIKSMAFSTCYSLTDVYFAGSKTQWSAISIADSQYGSSSSNTNLALIRATKHYGLSTVSFDAGGGSGDMPAVNVPTGTEWPLPACAFTAPEHKSFDHWELDGQPHAAGSPVTVSEDITLKACWTDKPADPVVIDTTPAVLTCGGSFSVADRVSGAVGAVSFAVTGELSGCSLDPETGVFTAGTAPGIGAVTVTVEETEQYLGTEATITVTVSHDPVKVEAVPATCTEDGAEAYWECRGCGKLFADEACETEITAPAVLPATGHAWDEGTVTAEPTCTQEGVRTYTCQNNPAHTRTEPIAKLTAEHASTVLMSDGGTLQLTADSLGGTLTWEIAEENQDAATVDSNGLVTLKPVSEQREVSVYVFNEEGNAIEYTLVIVPSGVETLVVPGTVDRIGEGAFSGSDSLKEVVIEDGVREIGEGAFSGCENLGPVQIPNSVETIGDGAFDGCPGIEIHCEPGSAAEQYAKENGLSVYAEPPTEICLDKEYVILYAGENSASESTGTVRLQVGGIDVVWLKQLSWETESGETAVIRRVSEEPDGAAIFEAVGEGTDFILASVSFGGKTYTARCRVDVVADVSRPETRIRDAVRSVSLPVTKATVELFKTDYTRIEVIPNLDQNDIGLAGNVIPQEPDTEQTGDAAILRAQFEDIGDGELLNGLFVLRVADDRTLEIVPLDSTLLTAEANAKAVKKSYKAKIVVEIDGKEFTTPQTLTLTVKQSRPAVKAAAVKLNSYMADSVELTFTGGIVKEVEKNPAKTNPGWLTLDGKTVRYNADGATGPKNKGTLYLLATAEGWAIRQEVAVSVSSAVTAPKPSFKPASLTLKPNTADIAETAVTVSPATFADAGKWPLTVSRVVEMKGSSVTAVWKDDQLDTECPLTVSLEENELCVGTRDGFADSAVRTFRVYLAVDGKELATALTVKTLATKTAVTASLTVSGTINTQLANSPVHVTAAFKNYHPNGSEVYSLKIYKVLGTSAEETEDLFRAEPAADNPAAFRVTVSNVDGVNALLQQKYSFRAVLSADIGAEKAVTAEKAITVKNTAPGTAALTAKASGLIDVIRPESTFITVTPTVKNFYDFDLRDAQITVAAKEKIGGKWQELPDWEPQFTAELQENGIILVRANTDHGIRTDRQYFLNLTLIDREGNPVHNAKGAVLTVSVKLNVKMGSAKFTQSTKTLLFLKKDAYSRGEVSITATDPTLNEIERIEVVSPTYKAGGQTLPMFEAVSTEGGTVILHFAGDRVTTEKNQTLKLKVYLKGNETGKPNATLSVKINVA